MARAKLAPVDVGDVKDVEGWMVVVSSLVSGSWRRGQVSTWHVIWMGLWGYTYIGKCIDYTKELYS